MTGGHQITYGRQERIPPETSQVRMKPHSFSSSTEEKQLYQPPRVVVPITSWEIDGEIVETVSDFIFGAPKSLQMVTAAMKLKDAYSLEGKL